MTYRIAILLALSFAVSAGLATADDKNSTNAPDIAPSSPPPQFAPMTRSERFSRYVAGLVDAESVLRSAASSGIRQATNAPKEWGGGAEAYGERLGSAFGEHVIQRTLQYGLSAALHEDNRYFVSQQSGFLRRTKYAIKSTMFARHDDGSQSFSFSRIGGAAGGAFISRAWQPRSTTSAGDGATSFGINIGSEIGFNIFREFWPDMKRHLHK